MLRDQPEAHRGDRGRAREFAASAQQTAGAQALIKAGCDAITLADNSLAILRVSNLAMGAIKLAKEIASAALGSYSGVYLITPFLQYETTVELAEFARGV